MKNIIKKHYQTPAVPSQLLKNILLQHQAVQRKFSWSIGISIFLMGNMCTLFIQHVLNFNLTYLDVTSALSSGVALPLMILGNIAIVLLQFIYQNIIMLTGVSILCGLVYMWHMIPLKYR